MDQTKIKAIIGLGNPGEEYADTYHNAGFMLIDFLIKKYNGECRRKYDIDYWTISPSGHNIALLKSDVFMNTSGEYVKRAFKALGCDKDDTLIAHDDSDILLGKFKYSKNSESAGHKGVESIIKVLGTKNFGRIRIGIRSQEGRAMEFVLKKIAKTDMAELETVFAGISEWLLKL